MFDNFLTLLGSKCSIGLSKGFSIFNYCFSIFGKEVCLLNITWYSLSYIIGLIIGLYYIKYILNRTKNKLISNSIIDGLLLWTMAGTIVGGRVGYALFYNASYYMSNPLKVFYVWEGGMSFHGALIGITLSILIFSKKYNINFYNIMDLIVCAAPIGIFLGRIANFLNGELWGKPTNLPWGVIFPCAGLEEYRHPSQLYEASLEGFLLFFILYYLVFYIKILSRPALASGIFCIIYATARIFVELFYRMPDQQIGYIYQNLTMGIILSLPVLIIGIFLTLKNNK